MTIDEIIKEIDSKSMGRTRYAGQELKWDEALVAEIRRLRRALYEMRLAYLNKDADCPHEFEKSALAETGRLIGNE